KPVERYEIVLGRFLGYGLLLTIGLIVLTGLSLGYLLRGINERAAAESLTARVVVVGEKPRFHIAGRGILDQGDSGGGEWEYRSYISYDSKTMMPGQHAFWAFRDEQLTQLADRGKPVRFEFAFDIFRTTKGQEGKGVFITFLFATGSMSPEEVIAFRKE